MTVETMLTCKILYTRYHKITTLLTMKLSDKSNRKKCIKNIHHFTSSNSCALYKSVTSPLFNMLLMISRKASSVIWKWDDYQDVSYNTVLHLQHLTGKPLCLIPVLKYRNALPDFNRAANDVRRLSVSFFNLNASNITVLQ